MKQIVQAATGWLESVEGTNSKLMVQSFYLSWRHLLEVEAKSTTAAHFEFDAMRRVSRCMPRSFRFTMGIKTSSRIDHILL